MRKILKKVTLSVSIILLVIFFVWVAARPDLLGNVGLPFGYYGDFNLAKRAIQATGCVDSIEYSRHEDLTLESFEFKVRTKSGRVVRLWFTYEMDADQVCMSPMGLLIENPKGLQSTSQAYSIEMLSGILKEKNFQVRNLKDILCNLDELATIFEANYYEESITKVSPMEEDEFLQYLQIEITDEESTKSFKYLRIE
jgi:hypothetical protein